MLKISHGFEVAAESLAYLLRIRTYETLVCLTANLSHVLLSNAHLVFRLFHSTVK